MGWVIIVNIFVVLVLLLSFVGGLKEGAVKKFFSLMALIIAIPLTGMSYHLPGRVLSLLPGENWGNFIGFLITLAVISIALHFTFFLPRKLFQRIWKRGVFFRLIGGILNILNSAIGMVVLTLLILAYPIIGWLERLVMDSSVLTWLVVQLAFVQAMLPEEFQYAINIVVWQAF